ncbi:MAG TPA: hypothetical protein VFT56_01125 [Sphingomonas sp.]|nr:hypothetical protein [Sphingomonas sp.]
MAWALHRPVRSDVQAPLWRALQQADRPVTIAELHVAAGVHPGSIDFRLNAWRRAGLVGRIEGRPHRYYMEAATDRHPSPPMIARGGRVVARKPAAYERIWTAIRVLKRFDLPSLSIAAGAGRRTTLNYVGLLQRVGYVRLDRLGNPRTGEVSRYSLARDTGRTAPRETILTVDGEPRRELVDRNTGERHDVSRGTPSRRRAYRQAAPAIAEERG